MYKLDVYAQLYKRLDEEKMQVKVCSNHQSMPEGCREKQKRQYSKHQKLIPVVPHKAAAEVSK